jgi:hypothetical protein
MPDGWWVRVQRIDCKVSRMFTDSKFGGRARALVAAKAYRDEVLREAPEPRNARVEPGHGYIRRRVINGRVVFRGWIRLEGMRCSRTVWHADVHGLKAAKAGAEAWLERHRRALRKPSRV